ncbi:family 43 glycosylhydrolase [Bifidobacterium amazonense]|uniref:Family 43 glycosylhydrolase n=1 Tax=Bifidobacterium amazonense TaxID=2809027 RepID=A0ABS9VS38_9BIFI|nr:family 43 glycosylhydrolase [Bifidobacterium amazonense]MCH9274805.1 family 43 glycosylhydrolase [Bifidobacterium amazonense]
MSSAYSLMCYTRIPTSRDEANNEDIALSMHLALRSQTTGEWMPLNENYGVFFAAAVPRDGVPASARRACTAAERLAGEPAADRPPVSDAVAFDAVMPDVDTVLKSLTDPYLFRLRDGRFGIAATRTARGGGADGSERSSFLLAVSRDLRSYTQLGMVRLDTEAGVRRPAVDFDGRRYVIRWRDDEGAAHAAATPDILAAANAAPLSVVDSVPVAPASPAAGEFPALGSIRPGNVVEITETEAAALIARFGRVYNTGVTVRPFSLPADLRGEDARAAVRTLANATATLRYSDGSDANRAVDWNADQLAALADDAAAGRLAPGQTRRIDGRVRQTVYPVPFAVERADPSVFAWNFNGEPMFLFIATDDTDGNCIDPNGGRTHMPLRVASSILELSDAAGGREREIDLLRRGDRNSEGRVMTGCFWAPELHVIGGRLSVLFMPCFDGGPTNPDGSPNPAAGRPDMWTGSCHIMQLKQDADGRDLDPRDAANWDAPRPILDPDGGPLNPVQRISLDMTVIQDSGRWYYAWQQVGSVWIAAFDPERPDRLTSKPRQIIVPEFAWDNLIAEGPNAVVHDGRIWLIYSGSLVGIDYTTGVVSAPAGQRADLTDPAVWTKLDYPLQKSGVYNGEWQLGTGHGMWSHDEDGNLIYVFHNAEYENGRYGGRDAQVRRVHWAADGMPILDMQSDEELNPAYACITMEIVVR